MEPKFGIIGCGGISRFHFDGLEKVGAKIVHISDLDEKAALPYIQRFGARFSTDYKEVLDDPEVTAVSVLTSSKYHKEICLAAIQAGKDVICEKTMMNNAEEAEAVAKAALVSGKLFFVAYMKRFFPASQKALDLLPGLGRIFSAQIRSYQSWGNLFERDDDKGLEWIIKGYGGAVMKCAGSHLIDLTLSFLGRPESIYANVDYIPNTKIDRKAVALFEYPNGMVATFETAAHPLKKIGYERNSWDESVQINGVNGRLELFPVMWDQPEKNAAMLVYYDNEKETSTEYRFDRINPFHVEMEYFYECLKNREQGNPDVIDGFNVDVIIQSMIESNRNKASIKIDWRGL